MNVTIQDLLQMIGEREVQLALLRREIEALKAKLEAL